MAHESFVLAAFAITGVGLAWLIVTSYTSMRRSEALAEDLRNDP